MAAISFRTELWHRYLDERLKPRVGAAALLIVAVTACAHQKRPATAASRGTGPVSLKDSAANGRLIFMSGRDIDGLAISASTKPLLPSCAACHKADGSGGVKFPDGAASADLRHSALVTHQTPPYNLTLLGRAISSGVDNKGKPLDRVMPRWRLSARDLHDIAQYVLTQLR